jgi:CRISPR-associated endonuclease Csy4
MDAYLELQLLPDPEFPARMLMNALFAKLHRALVSHGEGRIGISFPDVGKKAGELGERLRLHGQAGDLEKLMASNWLQGMRDHLAAFAIRPVPDGAKHRIVRRVQAQSNPERLRRRLIRRKGIGPEEARAAIPDSAAEMLTLPSLIVTSQSTQQQFRLFIEHLPLQAERTPGSFTAYGLSNEASIPWF